MGSPAYLKYNTWSPSLTSTGFRLPSFSFLPGPVRTTRPLIGRSLADDGNNTPPADTSACSCTYKSMTAQCLTCCWSRCLGALVLVGAAKVGLRWSQGSCCEHGKIQSMQLRTLQQQSTNELNNSDEVTVNCVPGARSLHAQVKLHCAGPSSTQQFWSNMDEQTA